MTVMNKAIYVATSEENSGKSVVVLGLLRMLLGKAAKVGYFKPIINDVKNGKIDNHINTAITYFNLKVNPNDVFSYTGSEFINVLNEGKEDEIIDTIIEKYKKIEEENDFVLVEGTDFSGKGLAIEQDVNILIAKNLGLPTIIVANGQDRTVDELIEYIQLIYNSYQERDVEVLSVVANKIDIDDIEELTQKLKKELPKKVLVNVIPKIASLQNPTVKEIVDAINGKVLFGSDFLNNQAATFTVGAMQLRNYLTHLKENSLVITPGDRADIILGALQANLSLKYPAISGIILTGGIIPEQPIIQLIDGLSEVIPIISVQEGTFSVANKIGNVKSKIYAGNKQKINALLHTFDAHINTKKLNKKLIDFDNDTITPRMFQYNLLKRAKKKRKHIVLPEGNDDRILIAASKLQEANVVDITILGDVEKIKASIFRLHISLDISKITVIDPKDTVYHYDFAETLFQLRKHKGLTIEMAKDLIKDVSYFGTMMVYKNLADGMVSGAAHTTQHTIKPALQFIKTKPGVSVVSSIFFMCLEDRVSVFGDCAINPNPTAEQLAEIAISSAVSSKNFGIEPKIAMLSYSSGTSGKGEDVDKVKKATEIVKQKRPDLKIEGPIQYDAAVDLTIGKSKLPNSEVAGQASVFIFPDLNTGNNTYKAVQRETGALAIGPMLQGLNKPVNDLSRGCTVDDIFNTVVLTAIQAQED